MDENKRFWHVLRLKVTLGSLDRGESAVLEGRIGLLGDRGLLVMVVMIVMSSVLFGTVGG